MPESPDHNPTFASVTAPGTAPEVEAEATVAPLPPLVSRILIACWILLFSVRWLVVQGMIAAGFFGPDLPTNLDRIDKLDRIDSSLGRCYLFLLSITLVVGGVRIVRSLGREIAKIGAQRI